MKEKLINLKFNDGTEIDYNFKHDPFVPPLYEDAYKEANKMIKEAIEYHNQTTGGKKTFQELSQIGNCVIDHGYDMPFEQLEIFNEAAFTYLLGELSVDA